MSNQNHQVIPNPKRKTHYEVPKYIPEYKTKGITPIPMGNNAFRQFEYDPNKQMYAQIMNQDMEEFDALLASEGEESNHHMNLPPSIIATPSKFVSSVPPDIFKHNDGNTIEVISPQPSITHNSTNTSDLPQLGEYILMVQDTSLLTGPLEKIENRIRTLVYGEDPEYPNIKNEDIVVLKRVGLKIGVFVEE